MIYYLNNSPEYLMHYGVLGMKWGQRRARKNASRSVNFRRSGQIEKAKKYAIKARKIESKHRSRAGDKAYNRVKATSTGKLIGQSILMGTYGSLKYHQAKTKGNSTGKAAVTGVLHNIGNIATNGILGVVEPRANASGNKKKNSK